VDSQKTKIQSPAKVIPRRITQTTTSHNIPTVFSIGWQASIFHPELEGAHSGPLGVVHHPGVQK